MRFRKGRRKKRKVKWKWKEKEIEEINNFTYLEYTVQSNGRQEMHVERLRKGMAVMKLIWGGGDSGVIGGNGFGYSIGWCGR